MSSPLIPSPLRKLVIERAKGKCEYCLISEDFAMYSHEIDHIIALKHGGETIASNLALSCLPCNRHKESDLASLDPITGEIVPLFNPRRQSWADHLPFRKNRLNNAMIVGITPVGNTISLLGSAWERAVGGSASRATGGRASGGRSQRDTGNEGKLGTRVNVKKGGR